jgi:signal transduction histidine kinase
MRDKEVAVLSKRPIWVKLLAGLCLLVLVVGVLATASLYTAYAYRALAKSLSWRVIELPLAAQLSRQVGELRVTLSELQGLRAATFPHGSADGAPVRAYMVRDQFRAQLVQVEDTLAKYRRLVENPTRADPRMSDNQCERDTLQQVETALGRVSAAHRDEDWILDGLKVGKLDAELEELQRLAGELPSHLHVKMAGFAHEVRGQYRTLIVGSWIVIAGAAMLFLLFVKLFYQWVFRPLHSLIDGSREVAAGNFRFRIHLDTKDEMAELAEAMNDMTERFEEIRDDLDHQVQERTKQVIRSEQLASVGFLAAGVAHEINNPLASIAMCAESLQMRAADVLDTGSKDYEVASRYLQMIQDEAFRCKEITDKLLDFSRVRPTERQSTDLGELVRGVIDMVGHLGRYQQKHVVFQPARPVVAVINPSEIKQVVLNLLTNALESMEDGGTVTVDLRAQHGVAELIFADDGCGIAPEVLEHIFEPFFTRRRAGQGTGLGLSISHRIVDGHGGNIEAASPGEGQGATFRVRLPLSQPNKEKTHQHQAA